MLQPAQRLRRDGQPCTLRGFPTGGSPMQTQPALRANVAQLPQAVLPTNTGCPSLAPAEALDDKASQARKTATKGCTVVPVQFSRWRCRGATHQYAGR